MADVLILIPARMAASRLPGKPLADIGGEPMIVHVLRRAKAAEDRARLHRLLPDKTTLDKLSRYEGHLSRQLYQALHELERLKAARAGAEVPLPAALDVTVNGPTQALEMALENASQS